MLRRIPNIETVLACEQGHIEFWVSQSKPLEGCLVCRTEQRVVTNNDEKIKFYWEFQIQYGREGLQNYIQEERDSE